MRRGTSLAPELDRIAELLGWMLAFPAVWAMSEGNNVIDLGHSFKGGATIWLELPTSHFERLEHQIVAWMADAVVMDMLLSTTGSTSSAPPAAPLVLYGYAPASPLPMGAAAAVAKHVGVFGFSASQPVPSAALRWFQQDADCWVAGDVGDLSGDTKSDWLDLSERKRLSGLLPGQVWARAGSTRTAVTMLVHPPQAQQYLAPGYRHEALKTLHLASVRQFSTVVCSLSEPAPAHADLYRQLCTKEALYAGWFRAKGRNRYSHGHDR